MSSLHCGIRVSATAANAVMRHVRIAYAVAVASALAPQRIHRRRQLIGGALATCSTALAPTLANALVKGSAPPPKASRGEKRTCKTIDECEEVGRQRAAAAFDAQNDQPFFTTKDGVRWRDVREGSGGEVGRGDGVGDAYVAHDCVCGGGTDSDAAVQ